MNEGERPIDPLHTPAGRIVQQELKAREQARQAAIEKGELFQERVHHRNEVRAAEMGLSYQEAVDLAHKDPEEFMRLSREADRKKEEEKRTEQSGQPTLWPDYGKGASKPFEHSVDTDIDLLHRAANDPRGLTKTEKSRLSQLKRSPRKITIPGRKQESWKIRLGRTAALNEALDAQKAGMNNVPQYRKFRTKPPRTRR